MPISMEQWRVATGLANARYAPCPVRSAASPRKYLSRGTLFLRACVAMLQALLILALDTDWWGPWVGFVRGHSVREPVVIVVVHLHVSGSEGQSSVRFYVPALRILLIIAGDVEENPGPPKVEGGVRPGLPELLKELGSYADWEFLGVFLRIDDDTITSIRSSETEVKRQCLKLFRVWLQTNPTASWEDLCKALEDVGDKTRAHSLREKYCRPAHQQTREERTRQGEGQTELHRAGPVAASYTEDTSTAESVASVQAPPKTHPQSTPPPTDVAQRQQVPAPPPALPPMDEYASCLKSVYMSKKLPTYSKWPPTSAKRFIHLAVVKKQRVSKQEANEFTRATIHGNIDDILHKKEPVDLSKVGWKEDGSPAKFILIEGSPGIGKTTFAWKLCRKWAKGKILTAYRLVVLLRLRDKRVREAKSALDLFYHFDPDLSIAVAKQVLRCNGRSLFLLFEGYDELPGKLQTEQSIFLDILYKNFLPEATVLVTSRPSATEFLHWTFREQISQHIEILGFTKEDIQSYIHSVTDDPQVQEDFTQYLKCYPYIQGMMYVPLNAVIVAEVYKESRDSPDKFIPTTMTELYTALTRGILLRYLLSHREYGKQTWTLCKFSDLPKEIYKQFNQVCSIAFNGMIKEEFIFDDLPKDFDSLDLMQSSPELYVGQGALVSFNFFHLTLQEYLAAVHISTRGPEEQIEYFSGSLHTVRPRLLRAPFQSDEDKTAQRLKNSLRFAAGVTKFENLPLDSLRSLLLEVGRISLDALHWLFEAQCIDTYSKAISGTTNLLYSHSVSMTPFDCFVLGHAVSRINCTWRVNLSNCPIGNEGLEMLVAGMHYNKDTSPHSHLPVSLELAYCDITPEGLHYLTEMPEHVATTVTWLNLQANHIGGGAVHFFSKLPALRSLKTLTLYGTKMTSEDTKALGEFLLQPDSQQLNHLNLGGNLLTPEDTGWILGALPHNTTLETLYLDGSHVTMENVSFLTRALRGHCGLKALSLVNCKIDSDIACEIASALCENSTLEQLHMSKNPIGARGAAAFADMLSKNRTLQYLDLDDDSIGEEGARKFAESLQYNTTLEILYLDGSCVTSENVSSLTRALRGHCGLKILTLNKCKIDSDIACEIASALCENSTLEKLYMNGNQICPQGAAAFADMLRKNRTLQKLYLGDDFIGEEGTRKLAESLQYNTTLNILRIPEKYRSSLPPELYSTIQDRLRFL